MPRDLASATVEPLPQRPVQPFVLVDLDEWAARDPEPARWAWDSFLPQGEVTLFPGPGGVGKSLLAQQLATCHAAGLPMLGVATAGGNTLYVTAEDDERELHWRQVHIARQLDLPIQSLAGKLHLASLRGRLNNELATFESDGRMRVAAAYGMLRATIEATAARLVILDNVAHLFAGNENDRGHVTAFANLLNGLCRDLGVTIVLIAHPNKAGDSYSGSTAWLNAVRSQITLTRPEGSMDPDERVLTLGKANYSRQGQELAFRWHDFTFILDDDLPIDQRTEIAAAAQAAHDNGAFLACLAERTRQHRAVSDGSGTNYAPAVFAEMPEAKGIGNARLKAAMERLFRIDQIEKTVLWRDTAKSRDVVGLREKRTEGLSPTAIPNRFPTTAPDRPQPVPPTAAPHTPSPKGEGGRGLLAASPALEQGHECTDDGARWGYVLAPGETGNEPLPGWEGIA